MLLLFCSDDAREWPRRLVICNLVAGVVVDDVVVVVVVVPSLKGICGVLVVVLDELELDDN